MRHFASRLPLLLAASATLVVGRDATTTGSSAVSTGSSHKCLAENVVNECVKDMKFQLENCATYDWDCQCIGSTNVVNCYNNCPEHPDRVGAQTIRQQNCANAHAYDTTTAATTPTATADANASSHTSFMSASSSTADSEATGTPSGLKSHSDSSDDSGSGSSSSEGPTKALTGLQASSSPSHGAAAVNGVQAAGGWIAFLGLALGVLV